MFSDPREMTRRFASVKKRIDPTPGEDRKYRKYIEIYADLFPSLRDAYGRLAS
jgi:hypothetical protein